MTQTSLLGSLGHRRWKLVSCQYIRNDQGDDMTLCNLTRPVDVSP